VPVLRNGKLVGIVSRANLIRALAMTVDATPIETEADDRRIREKLLVLRLKRKVHRVEANPPPSTASDQGCVGSPVNLLSVSEH
jgi:hypothetical protein